MNLQRRLFASSGSALFELDLHAGELRKAGVRLSLPAQSFHVLALLLERPGDLVTREELRQRLWPNGTFVDFEHGLNAVINRLRDTLGDSADRPRFIETVPRRGYRFIAPVDGHRPINQSGSNEPPLMLTSSRQTSHRPQPAIHRSRGASEAGSVPGGSRAERELLDERDRAHRCGDRRVAAPTSGGG